MICKNCGHTVRYLDGKLLHYADSSLYLCFSIPCDIHDCGCTIPQIDLKETDSI